MPSEFIDEALGVDTHAHHRPRGPRTLELVQAPSGLGDLLDLGEVLRFDGVDQEAVDRIVGDNHTNSLCLVRNELEGFAGSDLGGGVQLDAWRIVDGLELCLDLLKRVARPVAVITIDKGLVNFDVQATRGGDRLRGCNGSEERARDDEIGVQRRQRSGEQACLSLAHGIKWGIEVTT